MKRKRPAPARPPAAFTLLELLIVVAITITLASLTIPSIGSALTGMKLTTATQVVVDEIQVARATALARNAPVEVWFLKTSTNSPDQYQAVRTKIQDSTNLTWISRQRKLPEGIAFASKQPPGSINIIGAQTPTDSDGSGSAKGVSLRIFPSGRLEMENGSPTADASNPSGYVYLTIVSVAGYDPDGTAALPHNFATVQINPINARVVTYRP